MIDQFIVSGISGGLIILLIYLVVNIPKLYRSVKTGMFEVPKPNGISVLVILVLLVATSSFYWYELRPSEIRKECSWITDRKPDVLAVMEVTQEEADRKNAENKAKCESGDSGFLHEIICEQVVVPRTYKPAQQGEEYVRASTREEYATCLRHNGLD